MTTVLLWILAILGAALLALLLVPLDARADGRVVDGDGDARVRLRWGGGLLAVHAGIADGAEVRLLGLRVKRIRGLPRSRKAREERTERSRGGGRFWRHRQTWRLMAGRLLGALRLRGRVAGRVGLADPANTAAVAALLEIVPRRRRLDVGVVCDWTEETVSLEGTVTALVWPIALIVVGLGLLARRDVRAALRGAG